MRNSEKDAFGVGHGGTYGGDDGFFQPSIRCDPRPDKSCALRYLRLRRSHDYPGAQSPALSVLWHLLSALAPPTSSARPIRS